MISIVITVLSIVGSIASLLALLKDWQTRRIHVVYGIIFTLLAFLLIWTQTQLGEIRRIENKANGIIRSADFSSSGSQRGFMLASIAFMETYKDRFPDTYRLAATMCDNAGVTVGRPDDFDEKSGRGRTKASN